MRRYLITLLALGSITTTSYALFCPKNYNQIAIGDSIQQVEQQCGKPDGIKVSKGDNNGPQEWNYYVQPAMNNYTSMRIKGTQDASVKMAIALNGGKILNITVNGMSLANTTICGGRNISVGDTAESLKSACGDPVFVNKSAETSGVKPPDITEYKYNSTPPTLLVFVNGQLQERR